MLEVDQIYLAIVVRLIRVFEYPHAVKGKVLGLGHKGSGACGGTEYKGGLTLTPLR